LFDGQKVTVKAWITLRPEDKNLWSTWSDHEDRETTRCISLANYDSIDEELDGAFVDVTGVVRRDATDGGKRLRLAACRDLAIDVTDPATIRKVP
jgi:hypothetical protein